MPSDSTKALVEAIEFVRRFAKHDPVFAKGAEKIEIADARKIVAALDAAPSLPQPTGEADVEGAARAHHEDLRRRYPNSPHWEGMRERYRIEQRAAMRAALSLAPAPPDQDAELVAEAERRSEFLCLSWGVSEANADTADLIRRLATALSARSIELEAARSVCTDLWADFSDTFDPRLRAIAGRARAFLSKDGPK